MSTPGRITPAERFRAARRDPALAVLEGLHALKHAHRFGAELLEIVVCDALRPELLAAGLAPDLLPLLERAPRSSREAFAALAPAPHPTGVIALARRPQQTPAGIDALAGPVVLLERPTHAGNIGAAVRVAAAAGAAALLVLDGADPWSPAAIRGAAGLQFALPVLQVDALPGSTRPLVAVHPEGEPLVRGALPRDAILAFGSERTGLSPALRARAAHAVRIPMREGVSSLNLATAVAVVLYSGEW
jgi:TrmH family RNA methyltransferase